MRYKKTRHIIWCVLSFMAPPVRLERTTLRLTAACSTDWAKEEYIRMYYNIKCIRCKQFKETLLVKLVHHQGFEPGTHWLRVSCSTNWANGAYLGISRHRPIFPGRLQPSIFSTHELNYRVRNGNGWILVVIDTDYSFFWVTIPSAFASGSLYPQNQTALHLSNSESSLYPSISFAFAMNFFFWLSPRPISIGQLNASLHLHLRPIYHIVFMGSY